MKWVTAQDLDRWADTIGARVALSELVSSLVRAAAPDIISFRFPTGDSAQIPGYDGRLTAAGVPPYVPEGHSVWEFGVTTDYLGKANKEFKRRTENPNGVAPGETTFVFVTPRTWRSQSPSAEQWCADRRAESGWRDIRVIDGVALEDWLSQHEAVAARAARKILAVFPAKGARSVEEFWEEYSARFKPALAPQVLLCGREEQAQRLRDDLRGTPQDIIVRADSPDEVVAFVAAAILGADDESRKFLEARTLVVDIEEAARQVNQKSKIFVVRGTATSLGGWLSRNAVTIVPIGRDAPRRTGGVIVLNRPVIHSLAKALEGMGFGTEEARQLARTCGRSVTVLARRIPRGDGGRPPWADGRRIFIPALLAGGWDAESPHDQAIVATLAGGVAYGAFEAELHPFERLQDPPIDREGSVWKVRAPVDAFVHLGHLISRDDLDRLRAAATEVFGEEDPSLDLSDEERPFAAMRNQRLRHSEWLRDGLATTLLLIAVLHEEAGLVISGGITPQGFVDRIIEELPGLRRDHRLLASFRDELPLLMEAAPRPLLSALEHLLEGDGAKIRPMFREVGGLLAPSGAHTGLLWALETVAWDPDLLPRVAMILAKLAAVDPGGRLHNRPLNSLREIFLPWHPGTNASVAQRMAVLDQIVARDPSIGWSLLVALFPEHQDVAHPTETPRYREAGASERELLTWGRVFEGYRGVVERALQLVDDDIERWQTAIEEMHRFEPALRQRTCELLEGFVARGAGGSGVRLWALLQKTVNRHRAFHDTDWALKEPDLVRLDAIMRAAQPADIVERVEWLFNDDYPCVPSPESTGRRDAVDLAREEAVREVIATAGPSALVRFADRVAYPYHIAMSAKTSLSSIDDYDQLVRQSLGRGDRLGNFALALSGEAQRRFGNDWQQRVRRLAETRQWTAEEIATLVLGWQDAPSTWDAVEELGSEVAASYWSRKRAWPSSDLPSDALQRAIGRYLAVGRGTAALETMEREIRRVPVDQIFAVLDALPAEIARMERPASSMLVHAIGETLRELGTRGDIPKIDVAKREYALLPLFGYRERPLTLHRVLAESPELFVSVLSDVFRPKSGDPAEPTEEQRVRAEIGYRILSSFRMVPGHRGDGLDRDALYRWVREVRRLASDADRIDIADEQIGQILAHASDDPEDHAWPHCAVRDLIEELASQHVERGVEVERHNVRGVVSKAIFEGGRQERALAEEARGWARASARWPRTAAMLLSVAQMWDAMADREDQRARHDEMRFE